MKIRSGFVSNSSSSSFIIGVGLVPSDRVEEALKLKEAAGWSVDVIDIPEAIERGTSSWDRDGLDTERDVYKITSFNYDEVSIRGIMDAYEKDQGVRIITMEGSGADPTYDEDSWEYDYDAVDYDWFSKAKQDVASFIESVGGQVIFGAGRNG